MRLSTKRYIFHLPRRIPFVFSPLCSCILYGSCRSLLYTTHIISRNNGYMAIIFHIVLEHLPENRDTHRGLTKSHHSSTFSVAKFPTLLLWYWPFNRLGHFSIGAPFNRRNQNIRTTLPIHISLTFHTSVSGQVV